MDTISSLETALNSTLVAIYVCAYITKFVYGKKSLLPSMKLLVANRISARENLGRCGFKKENDDPIFSA